MQREQRGQRLTYGAEAKTDFFEGRYFFGVDGKIHTYSTWTRASEEPPTKKEAQNEN